MGLFIDISFCEFFEKEDLNLIAFDTLQSNFLFQNILISYRFGQIGSLAAAEKLIQALGLAYLETLRLGKGPDLVKTSLVRTLQAASYQLTIEDRPPQTPTSSLRTTSNEITQGAFFETIHKSDKRRYLWYWIANNLAEIEQFFASPVNQVAIQEIANAIGPELASDLSWDLVERLELHFRDYDASTLADLVTELSSLDRFGLLNKQ